QSVSPDGSAIAFIARAHMHSVRNGVDVRRIWNSDIWIMNADGENATRIISGDTLTWFGSIRWSPDGKRIAYQSFHRENGETVRYSVVTSNLKGGTLSTVAAARRYQGSSLDHVFPEDFCWLPDGRIVYAVREPSPNSRDSNLWALNVDARS